MQVKKHTIQISMVLMIISLTALTMLQFQLYPVPFKVWLNDLIRDYLIIISGGVFTSTFVTVSISIREYKDVKVETLIDYYNASSDFLKNFRNIQYLYLAQPFDIVQGCFWEEEENKSKEKINAQIEELIKKTGGKKSKKTYMRVYEKLSFEEKEKMKVYIWKNTNEEIKCRIRDEKQKTQFLEDEYRRIMQNYYVKIDEVMKQYIEIKKCSYDLVEKAFGKVDFIFSNQKLRKEFIYEKLHDKQRAVLHTIREEAWHFEEYYKMEIGNLPVMLNKIMKIQDILFQIQEGEIGYTIYNLYCYEMDIQLSELLSVTYGKGYKKDEPYLKNYAVISKIDSRKLKEVKKKEKLDKMMLQR